jgi:hypothetical protein
MPMRTTIEEQREQTDRGFSRSFGEGYPPVLGFPHIATTTLKIISVKKQCVIEKYSSGTGSAFHGQYENAS